MMTAEQKSWLRNLIKPTGAQDEQGADADTLSLPRGKGGKERHGATVDVEEIEITLSGPDDGAGSDRDGGATTRALKIPGIPDIPGADDVIDDLDKKLNGPFSCTGLIQNNTGHTLTLDVSSVGKAFSGEYQKLPPGKIGPNGTGDFKAIGTPAVDIPILDHFTSTGAEGAVRYTLEDGQTVWTLYFNVPRAGKNKIEGDHGKSGLDGPAAKDLQVLAKPGSGNEATFNYMLLGPGDPNKPPNGGDTPGANINCSCMVTVTNNTQQVLTLAHQGHDTGDFMTFPPPSIQPGASASFVSVETPHAKEQGIKGFAVWNVGDAPPAAGAVWRIEWENPEGAKNTAHATLDPQSAGFASLEQIGQGDENVPTAFTISGGGGGTGPVVQKGASCEITITNNAKVALSLTNKRTTAGTFSSEPPPKIEAGATAKVSHASAPNSPDAGCVGGLDYAIGDDQAAATWTIDWNNPAGQDNTCTGTVNPADAGFKSESSIGSGDEKVPVSFVLSGDGGGKPEQTVPFAPPTESKQPTLRKGDNSADGWVEYLQKLLNQGQHAGLKEDGNFDDATRRAVLAFQKKMGIKEDGIVGNQTWAALRGTAPEPPSTDGRTPHTFVEQGQEARWWIEGNSTCQYSASADELTMFAISTGTDQIKGAKATVRITPPDGEALTVQVPLDDLSVSRGGGQQGAVTLTIVQKLKSKFPKSKADPKDYFVEAYMDQALGGDLWTGKPVVVQ